MFLSVTALSVLVVPMSWLPKTSESGLNEVTAPPTALPLRETTWTDPAALSLKLRVAVRVPAAVGVKVIET